MIDTDDKNLANQNSKDSCNRYSYDYTAEKFLELVEKNELKEKVNSPDNNDK